VRNCQHLRPGTGERRLVSAAVPMAPPRDATWWQVDSALDVGDEVVGPEAVFASVIADVNLAAKDVKTARRLAAQVLAHPPSVDSSRPG
jgi:hypothetical protein